MSVVVQAPGPRNRQRLATLGSVAAHLLRRRPTAQSAHLSLVVSEPGEAQPVLLMTVPKKVLARAVDRNQFRRIARECWQELPAAGRASSALVRLKRKPADFALWPRGERARRWRHELGALFGAARPAAARAGFQSPGSRMSQTLQR